MENIWKRAGVLLALIICAAGVAGGEAAQSGVAPAKYSLRLAHGLSEGSSYDLGCKKFAELVAEYSAGEIVVKIYPEAQLGTEQETVNMVHDGSLDLSLQAMNNSTMWYPSLDIYVMPFIFRNRKHAEQVFSGPVGQKLEQEYVKASAMRIVSWFEWGDRSIFNRIRPVNAPEDLRGIRIRVPNNPVMIDTYNALGAEAVAIDWGNLYQALGRNEVDGLEGPPQGMVDMKFYDFLKYYSYVNVFYGLADIVINEELFQGMSSKNKMALLRAGKEAGTYQRWLSAKSHMIALKKLTDLGVKVNKVENAGAFVEKVKPVWDKYKETLGTELFDAVINTE